MSDIHHYYYSNNLEVNEDTQRIYYYDDEDEEYEDGDYNYKDAYSNDDEGVSDSSGMSKYLQFPLVTPSRTTTTTTTITTTTTTRKTAEQSRRNTPGRNSYNSGGYKRHESSNEFDKQRPGSYQSGPKKTSAKTTDVACNSPQMLKKFLKSGAHGNDPRKIQAMIMKCQMDKDKAQDSKSHTGSEDEDETNAKSIFEKYSSTNTKYDIKKQTKNVQNDDLSENEYVELPPKPFLPPGYKGFETSKKSYKIKDSNRKLGTSFTKNKSISDEEEYEDDDEYYDDDEDYGTSDDKDNAFKPFGGVARPKGTSTSSNLFRKFINNNAGKSVRRPINTNDEESKVASDIFKKYSSGSIKRPKGSYSKV